MSKRCKQILITLLCLIILLTTVSLVVIVKKSTKQTIDIIDETNEMKLIQAEDKKLVTSDKNEIVLKGTNAGGYLLQELWMTPTENSENVKAENDIYVTLDNRFGIEKRNELLNQYMDAYWTEKDFKNCKDIGMNCIRLPFWYRNLVDENGDFYGYDGNAADSYGKAFERLDWFINTAGRYGLYVILDFHGAPGSQSGSDHSGIDGGTNKRLASEFFYGKNAKNNQELYYSIWEVIADRYKNNPIVAGYDLLNEPYSSYRNGASEEEVNRLHTDLWNVYDKAYDRIRTIDSNHLIIMEAVYKPDDLPDPQNFGWKNIMYEYHYYCNTNLNNENGQQVNSLLECLNEILSKNYNVPNYLGEFCMRDNIDAWDKGMILLDQTGLSWTTWTYRVMPYYKNWGLYNNIESDKEVNVEYDSFSSIKKTWRNAGKSKENKPLIQVLKKYCNP